MNDDDALPPDHRSYQRKRAYSISTISTDATAPNLPGPGRNVGCLFHWLGGRLETFMNKHASQLGRGPQAVADEIRRLRQHSILDGPLSSAFLSEDEEKDLKRLLKRLLKYTRLVFWNFPVASITGIFALERCRSTPKKIHWQACYRNLKAVQRDFYTSN